ncbi:MAG: carbon starvation protein A [Planctomycetes bacterium]|nr:carbon starvation protein A [Planctomycetota bacterium]
MSLTVIAIVVLAAFGTAYLVYGRILARGFKLDDAATTPAHEMNDGVDYAPTAPGMLAAQHFSAITAAGPIVGPIFAGMMFGWLPALLWIVLGCIFIGAVHDFSALVASVRHKARSVAEVMREHTSGRAFYVFLTFIWLSLMYVIVAFTDLTARAFVSDSYGPGVASSSGMYLLLAFILGVAFKYKLPSVPATLIFVPILFFIVWFGQKIPVTAPDLAVFGAPAGLAGDKLSFLHRHHFWELAILCYCALASVVPLWALLQPRGFLGGWFLYVAIVAGLLGIIVGPLVFTTGFSITWPAFVGWGSGAKFLFPFLFVTIACGACSGFHGIVCSGTTSKQIDREGHARPVGYGAMLGEGVVAVISLATVMVLAPGTKGAPDDIYARGIANFLRLFRIPTDFAISFGTLAFATFIFDTLDVCTRLGRQIFTELSGMKGHTGRIIGTVFTLAIPGYFLMTATGEAWKTYWLVFGTSNQLLAGLTLLGITVWLLQSKKRAWFVGLPMVFLIITTMTSLVLFMKEGFTAGASLQTKQAAVVAAVLFVLAAWLVVEAILATKRAYAGSGDPQHA